ncbi:hypothetical protein FACS1894132_08120 [Clostridia bacterium]|nr:hypothetical protein FACS1894132_08120 [Clostridia bacterium]
MKINYNECEHICYNCLYCEVNIYRGQLFCVKSANESTSCCEQKFDRQKVKFIEQNDTCEDFESTLLK